MFSDHPRSSDFDTPESGLRFSIMLAELWHDWFDAMSELAYRTHRACEFLAEGGAFMNGREPPFDFRPPRQPSEGPGGSIDMAKLKECLQSMDSTQAAQVMHAIQIMQAMDAMAKRRRSRPNEAEGDPW